MASGGEAAKKQRKRGFYNKKLSQSGLRKTPVTSATGGKKSPEDK